MHAFVFRLPSHEGSTFQTSTPPVRNGRTRGWCADVGLVMGFVSFAAMAQAGNVLHVPADYPTIQEALDAAIDGDEVVVAPGTYALDDTIVFPAAAVTLRASSADPSATLLDGAALANEPGVAMIAVGDDVAGTRTIQGFTLRNGPSALLVDSAAESGRVRVAGNRFEANGPWACIRMGALDTEVTDNVFADNATYVYGALFLTGNAIVTGNTFARNDALPFDTIELTQGGGIYFTQLNERDGLVAEVRANHFEQNTCTDYGGAINVGAWQGMIAIEGNTFFENVAGACAAALYEFGSTSALTIEGNLFVRNASPEGAAIALEQHDDSIIRGNTFVGHTSAEALKLKATTNVRVERNLLAFNPGGDLLQMGATASVVACNDFFGNAPRASGGNISEDPLFCDASADDYTLAEGSPCLPAENGCGVQIGAFGVGCAKSPSVVTSWAALKGRFATPR